MLLPRGWEKAIERKQADFALQKSEKRFRDLVKNSLTGISVVQDNKVIYQNQEQERILGPLPRLYLFADFKGIHPDDVEKVKSKYQEIISGKARRIHMDFRCYPSGRMESETDMKWVYCLAILTEYEGKDAILFNIMDMTKAKELEQLLTINDKMASLGRVAAGIAHEIRNPLSGINIYLNTLEKIYDRPDSQPKVEQILSQLKSASRKIESIIRRVMDFSKPGEPKFALTDINKPVEEAVNLTAVTLRKSGIKLQMSLAENLPLCKVDHNLIEETVLNLINNAAQAMKLMEEGKLINVTSASEHNRIIVRISDSGPGVLKDIRDKIFDPFFTTKSDSTGIGLSLCHRIIADHGGSLTVSDSDLGGAEFRIEIPIKSIKKAREANKANAQA